MRVRGHPRGLVSFVETINLTEPFAAFNGALIQRPDGETLVEHLCRLQSAVVCWILSKTRDWISGFIAITIGTSGRRTPHVDREEHTVGFSPIIERDLREVLGMAAKLVVVGDPALVEQVEPTVLEEVGSHVSATKSKPRFLDITAADAHKGTVVTQLSSILQIPAARIAVIGDGLNDVLMSSARVSASRWDRRTTKCGAPQMW